jgi:esterase
MKLFYRKIGEGRPLIILHGLFGQSDNWNSFGKQFSENGFAVYLVDLRNHGLSPHDERWNYQVMSEDILELINGNNLTKEGPVILLGHSMGGKVAMQFALQHPELIAKMIIVDVAPKYYPPHHQDVLSGLNAVDLHLLKTRKDAEVILSQYINDVGTKQFLLKNLYWKENNENVEPTFSWRFNLKVISNNINKIGEAIATDKQCDTTSLFMRGARSNYILDQDEKLIKEIFPHSTIETIADAAHWIQVDKPKEFFELVMRFVK